MKFVKENNLVDTSLARYAKMFISFISLGALFSAVISIEYNYYNVGVLMTTKLNSPFDLERCGPAVDLALKDVNEKILKARNIQLRKVQAR